MGSKLGLCDQFGLGVPGRVKNERSELEIEGGRKEGNSGGPGVCHFRFRPLRLGGRCYR